MKYMGSKARHAKEMLPIILKDRKEGQWYVEPFVGGCNMIDKVDGNRIASDSNEYIAAMWGAMVNDNWIPPDKITEEEYNKIKQNKDNAPKELVGFTGVAVTFGSTWFGTYARNKRGTNYALEGRANLLKQVQLLKGVVFHSVSYENLNIPPNSIIYCDPPYKGTAKYKDDFNHDKFYEWCRQKHKEGHKVFVSEYEMPDDFICVWSKQVGGV